MKIAIYPGSFDPVTNGHLDIIERARHLFDHLIVAISHNPSKKALFTLEERKTLLRKTVSHIESVEVDCFAKLLVDFVQDKKACTVVRGLRAVSDFDYEYAMYQMNAEISPSFETIFLLASQRYSFLSSSILKELARYGQSTVSYTPVVVNQALLKKLQNQ